MTRFPFCWYVLESILLNGGRLSLIAKRSVSGKLSQPGLAFESKKDAFPVIIFGGEMPKEWKESRAILDNVRKLVHEKDSEQKEEKIRLLWAKLRTYTQEPQDLLEDIDSILVGEWELVAVA